MKIAGQGVGAFGVSQIRNFYLDKRFREMNSHLAQNERIAPVLEEVQTTLDNFENVGMEGKLSQFKEALLRYATNAPDNRELANIVRESAFDIVKMFNSYQRDLTRLLNDNVFELRETVNYVNTIIEKITNLNVAIVKEYKATEFGAIHQGRGVSPYGPLELMDERNRLLDELSTYVNIRVAENNDGSIDVMIGERLMIEGDKNEVLVMRDYDSFGAAMIYSSDGKELNIRSGELRAYIDLVNGNGPYANHHQSSFYGIPYYLSAIDAFAESFAALMNEANGMTLFDSHRAMFGSSLDEYDANGNLISRGPITAATIRISEEWSSNNATMIGLVHTESERTISTFGFTPDGVPNSFDVTLGTNTQTITFDGAAADLQMQLDAHFPGAIVVTNEEDGSVIIRALNNTLPLNVSVTGAPTVTPTTTSVTSFSLPEGTDPTALNITLDGVPHAITFDGTLVDLQAELAGLGIDAVQDGSNLILTSQNPAEVLTVTSPDVTVTSSTTTTTNANEFSYSPSGEPSIFSVTFNGTTVDIDFDGSDTDLQARLNAEFGAGNIIVSPPVGGSFVINAANSGDTLNITISPDAQFLTQTDTTITDTYWAFSPNLDGNHAHALMLALDTQEVSFGRALDFRGTMFDYVAFISNRLGQGLNFIDEQIDTLTVTTNNLLDSRDAVMGVSTDEEGINMLIYTKWYNAAARLMTAMDELLDRVINGMGRVGL
jgi:flagellar hook-associated protein FlgK